MSKRKVKQGPQPKLSRSPFKSSVVRSNNTHSMEVVHRELIFSNNGTIYSTPIRVCQFNPGALPWLQALSTRFEYYELLSAKLELKTFNSATNPGALSMSVDYDVSDPDPIDATQMQNGGNSVTTSVWKDAVLPIRCGDIVPRRKTISPGFVPTGTDAKLYDAFSVFMQNAVAGYYQLYISYAIRLTVPQISNADGGVVEGSPTIKTTSNDHAPVLLAPENVDDRLPVRIMEADSSLLGTVMAGAQMLGIPPNSKLLVTLKQVASGTDASLSAGLHSQGIISSVPIVSPTQNAAADEIYHSYELTTGPLWGYIQPYLISGAVTLLSQIMYLGKQ